MNKLSIKNECENPYCNIAKIQPYQDLWHYLQNTSKHIVMYGMGNGADKILSVCSGYNIEVEDFFASDGFVRGHSFHGKVVLSYSDVKEKYGTDNIIVLLSFASSLPPVLENIYKIADECELYAPDVPVFGNNLFNYDFFCNNKDKIENVRSLFADDESVRIFDNIIAYKLSGDISFLRACESDKDGAYRDILHAENFETVADLGAYNGDTVREIIPFCSKLKKVFALEPDVRNFRKLNEYYTYIPSPSFELEAINAGAWDKEDILFFDKSGNRNSGILQNASDFSEAINRRTKKITEVKVNSLDNILNGKHVDYIKYDVEGSEREALTGSAKTIREHTPSLLVSLYHRSEDIFELPSLVRMLNPNYKLYLRRMSYIPAWDINLYAVQK